MADEYEAKTELQNMMTSASSIEEQLAILEDQEAGGMEKAKVAEKRSKLLKTKADLAKKSVELRKTIERYAWARKSPQQRFAAKIEETLRKAEKR